MDADGCVKRSAITSAFARVVAYPAMHRRHRVIPDQCLPGLAILARLGQFEPGLDILPCGTRVVAGWQQIRVNRTTNPDRSGTLAVGQIHNGRHVTEPSHKRHTFLQIALEQPSQSRDLRYFRRAFPVALRNCFVSWHACCAKQPKVVPASSYRSIGTRTTLGTVPGLLMPDYANQYRNQRFWTNRQKSPESRSIQPPNRVRWSERCHRTKDARASAQV